MSQVLINLDVPDIEAAVKFYTEGLSLRVGRRFDAEFVELVGLTSPVYLLKKDSGTVPFPGGNVKRTYDRHWCPVHLDFIVTDIEAARERVLKAGALEEYPVTPKPYGKISMYRDPFGHGICLIEFNEAGYDSLPHL